MMRRNINGIALATMIFLLFVARGSAQTTQPPAPLVYQRADVKGLMQRVLDFQAKAYGEKPQVNWQAGAFWASVVASYQATSDQAFLDAARKWGESVNWRIAPDKRPFHGDSIAVGMAYLDIYAIDKQPKEIESLTAKLEPYLDKKTIAHGEVGGAPGITDNAPFIGRNVWWWCDALFMAPPTFAKMAAVTGDQRYLDLTNDLYWDSVQWLYDPAEGLFYRDARYFADKKLSPGGKKIFWGRGNGWVYAGIIRTLDAMPQNDPHRQKFVELFKKMTPAIVKFQGDDGLWRASLNEPGWFPKPETSGSGFFCYGLFAGINRGYLDRQTYLPIALRAWQGLVSHLNSDGLLGFSQKEGGAPGDTDANTFRDYANGAFLLAGSELYKMNLTAKDVTRMAKPD